MNSGQNFIQQFISTLNSADDFSIAFKIGSLEVKWYGILITIGFVAAIILTVIKLVVWYKISYEPFLFYCILGVPVSILGARTWSFVIGDSTVKPNSNFFIDFWDFRHGGLAIQGSVVSCVILALIFFPLVLKKPNYQVKTLDEDGNYYVRQVSTWVYADAIVPCVLIGQVIGRWGNFFNHELYGAPVENLDWLKVVMPKVVDGMFIDGKFRQPLFLYESFINFFVFLFLYVAAEFIKFRKAGDLAILYFVFYGIVRLCMEPFRDQNFKFIGSIITSILYIVIGITMLFINHFVISNKREYDVYAIIGQSIWFHCYYRWTKEMRNSPARRNEVWKKLKKKFVRTKEQMLYYNGY